LNICTLISFVFKICQNNDKSIPTMTHNISDISPVKIDT